jgi:hypothetical protein
MQDAEKDAGSAGSGHFISGSLLTERSNLLNQ